MRALFFKRVCAQLASSPPIVPQPTIPMETLERFLDKDLRLNFLDSVALINKNHLWAMLPRRYFFHHRVRNNNDLILRLSPSGGGPVHTDRPAPALAANHIRFDTRTVVEIDNLD